MPTYKIKMIFETQIDFDDNPDKSEVKNLEDVCDYVYDEYINLIHNDNVVRDFEVTKEK